QRLQVDLRLATAGDAMQENRTWTRVQNFVQGDLLVRRKWQWFSGRNGTAEQGIAPDLDLFDSNNVAAHQRLQLSRRQAAGFREHARRPVGLVEKLHRFLAQSLAPGML